MRDPALSFSTKDRAGRTPRLGGGTSSRSVYYYVLASSRVCKPFVPLRLWRFFAAWVRLALLPFRRRPRSCTHLSIARARRFPNLRLTRRMFHMRTMNAERWLRNRACARSRFAWPCPTYCQRRGDQVVYLPPLRGYPVRGLKPAARTGRMSLPHATRASETRPGSAWKPVARGAGRRARLSRRQTPAAR